MIYRQEGSMSMKTELEIVEINLYNQLEDRLFTRPGD